MSSAFAPPDTVLFRSLWQAQKGCCALCGEPMPANQFDTAHASLWRKWRPTFDHIKARAKGGSDAPENLRLAHAQCNRERGTG